MSTSIELSDRPTKMQVWTGRVLSALPAMFLLLDGAMKIPKPSFVVEATTNLGYRENVIVPLGITLLICTLLYIIPQTAVLGAVLLPGTWVARWPRTFVSATGRLKSSSP